MSFRRLSRIVFMKVGRVVLLVALMAALAAVVWFATRPGEAVRLVAVRRGDIVHSLVANGRLESVQTVELVPKVSARIKSIQVKEGEEVKTGQELVLLDDAELIASRAEAQHALEASKARKEDLFRGTRKEDIDVARAQANEAEQSLAAARAHLAHVERGTRAEDIDVARAQLHAAEADVEYTTKDWDRMQALLFHGLVTRREGDEAKRRFDTSRAVLDEARARLDRAQNGSTEEEKAEAKAAGDAAEARLVRANATLARAEAGPTAEEKAAAQAEMDRAQSALDRIDAQISETKLVSPLHAVVARKRREVGDLAFPEMPTPILELAGLDAREVRAEVVESDIYKVHEGLEATITADAYPGRRWKGKVVRLAPSLGRKMLAGARPEEKTDVKVREARIAIEGAVDAPLDLPVEAHISEAVKKDVLLLPVRAVDVAGNVRLEDGSLRKVEIGERDDAFVEVLSGLSAGEQVRVPE